MAPAKQLVEASFADRAFFANTGMEANEAAIKFARKFQRVVHPDVDTPTEFLAFNNCFHGRTMGSMWDLVVLALLTQEQRGLLQFLLPFLPWIFLVACLSYFCVAALARVNLPMRLGSSIWPPPWGLQCPSSCLIGP